MNKKAELKRLHSIVFEGAPPDAKYFYMNRSGVWCYQSQSKFNPDDNDGKWRDEITCVGICKNQPKTDLDWTDALIIRN